MARITKPIYKLLKFCDSDGMSEFYEKIDNLVGEVKDVMRSNRHENEYSKIEEILDIVWDKITIHLHCFDFALKPRFHDQIYHETPTLHVTLERLSIWTLR